VLHTLIWGPWSFVWRGEAHQSIPVATGLNLPELPISDEARNDAHGASAGVKTAGYISAYPGLPYQKTKQETNDASKSQLKQASWNRTVLKFGSENHTAVIIFNSFLWFSLDSLIWVKSRHYQFNWVCAAHLEYRSLVLRNVGITGVWVS